MGFGSGYNMARDGSDGPIIASTQAIIHSVEVESRTSTKIVTRISMGENSKTKESVVVF